MKVRLILVALLFAGHSWAEQLSPKYYCEQVGNKLNKVQLWIPLDVTNAIGARRLRYILGGKPSGKTSFESSQGAVLEDNLNYGTTFLSTNQELKIQLSEETSEIVYFSMTSYHEAADTIVDGKLIQVHGVYPNQYRLAIRENVTTAYYIRGKKPMELDEAKALIHGPSVAPFVQNRTDWEVDMLRCSTTQKEVTKDQE